MAQTASKPKKWMQKAFGNNPGGLHRALGVPQGETIPAKKMAKAKKSKDPHVREMVNLAQRGKEASGQDTSILGTSCGRPGGHAGYGKGVASYGTEAMEEHPDHLNPYHGSEFGGGMDNTGSQHSTRMPTS